jgi:hypothetical protein
MTAQCIACGMPMESAEDHALGDSGKAYCRYCARPDGSMQSYEEKLTSFSKWLIDTQSLDAGAAREQAATVLSQLPAWRNAPA